MEPISHTTLVMMLKHALNRHGMPIEDLCRKHNILPADVLGILSNTRFANVGTIAKLAHAFGLDWSGIWARYSYWRYLEETRKVTQPKKPNVTASVIERAAYEHELRAIALQIIKDAPDIPADMLADNVSKGLSLDMQQTLNLIAEVRRPKREDYAYG